MIVGKSPAALAPFLHDRRWQAGDAGGVRPWTDDYTNLFGAFVRKLNERAVTPPAPERAPAG